MTLVGAAPSMEFGSQGRALGTRLDEETVPGLTGHVLRSRQGPACDNGSVHSRNCSWSESGFQSSLLWEPWLSVTLGDRSPVPQPLDSPMNSTFSAPHILGSSILDPPVFPPRSWLHLNWEQSGCHLPGITALSRGRDGGVSWLPPGALGTCHWPDTGT